MLENKSCSTIWVDPKQFLNPKKLQLEKTMKCNKSVSQDKSESSPRGAGFACVGVDKPSKIEIMYSPAQIIELDWSVCGCSPG